MADKKALEKELYEPVRKHLESKFKEVFEDCHLEITANGLFSDELKSVVQHDIVFSFLGKSASPDLAGFAKVGFPGMITFYTDIKFITVEETALPLLARQGLLKW